MLIYLKRRLPIYVIFARIFNTMYGTLLCDPLYAVLSYTTMSHEKGVFLRFVVFTFACNMKEN